MKHFLEDDTEIRSYFLGLYMADGWCDNKNHFFISLKDKEFVEDLAKIILYENKITVCKNKSKFNPTTSFCYRLSFGTNSFSSKMKEFGFVDIRKTGNEFFPKCISEQNIRHFLRGLSDGDGCFSITKNKNDKKLLCWELTSASENFLEELVNYFRQNNICAPNSISVRKRDKTKAFRISLSHHSAVRFGEHIYTEASFFLKRKYLVFSEGKKIQTKRNPNWTKEEIEKIIAGEFPLNRTKSAINAKLHLLKNP